jgi:hypothetical protein
LGGIFFFRFSALTIAREKGVRASAEVMVRAGVGVVRRGVFQRWVENEEVAERAQRVNYQRPNFPGSVNAGFQATRMGRRAASPTR